MAQSHAERVRAHRARKALDDEAVKLGTLLGNNESDRRQETGQRRKDRIERAVGYQRWHVEEFGVLATP